MHWVDHRGIQCLHSIKNTPEIFVRIRILLTVAGEIVEFGRDLQRSALEIHDARQFTAVQLPGVVAEGVIHRVSHQYHRILEAFPTEKLHAGGGTYQVQTGNMIRHDAVDFLRAFQRSQAVTRFHMADGDMELYGRQCRSHGGIGVAEDQHHVRRFLYEDFLQFFQHLPGHLAVASAGDPQIIIRLGNIHLFKKDIGHIVVIVLSRVDEHFLKLLPQDPGHHG
ncbi:Uncharacterised protein [uncultured Blautia sp.]|nr:Uncharacterised protein [uncultured Blautia sp.]